MSDKKYVIRRLRGVKTVHVYDLSNGTMELKGEVQVQKFNKSDILAMDQFKDIKKPYVDIVKTEEVKYGMEVDEFMKHAIILKDKAKEDQE